MNNGKKNNNGWLIAVVIAIVVLLIGIVIGSVVFVYALMEKTSETAKSIVGMYEEGSFEKNPELEDDFDFGFEDSYQYKKENNEEADELWEKDLEEYSSEQYEDSHSGNNDNQGEIKEDDYCYIDKETGEKYYEKLKDAIRYDLDYHVSWQDYEYDTEYENVMITASYPKLEGENIPNLDYINDYIFDEVEFWTKSFEEYVEEGYYIENEEFLFDIFGYVTYMDEEKISIVYSESGYADGTSLNYLFSVNVDVQNGVILDNASIINMDDEFAVEFRERNRTQNDADGYIDELTDQEIVEYLNSPEMGVVFYTPLGLEVGINLDYGWYTVTYRDYEKYLKKL